MVNVVIYLQMVSGGEDSMVNVWQMVSGERVMQFVAHRKTVNGQEIDVSISRMQFDPTLRRLITAARDGTVKMWNFNNGALLRVLHQYGDFEVTGIVCPPNKIITCGWNQRLDVHIDDKEDEMTFQWKHYHKDDILAMDFYPPSSIVASASFDGNILIWSLETGYVTMRFNAFESDKPLTMTRRETYAKDTKDGTYFDAMSALGRYEAHQKKLRSIFDTSSTKLDASKQHTTPEVAVRHENTTPAASKKSLGGSGLALADYRKLMKLIADETNDKDKDNRCRNTAIDNLLFLTSREINCKTATLIASGAQGWVRAWSTHHAGGLLGQFNAAQKPNESVIALTTDPKNQYLITGDTVGYIKVWDISDYCNHNPVKQDKYKDRLDKFHYFPFMRIAAKLRQKAKDQTKHPSPPSSSVPWLTVKVPPILNSFRAHLSPVITLAYIPDKELIISGSTDCSVRLWTLPGQYIGIFGQQGPWKWPVLSTKDNDMTDEDGFLNGELAGRNLPSDVRQVASSTTLKVIRNLFLLQF